MQALEALRGAWVASPNELLVEPAQRLLESSEAEPHALKTATATQAQWLELLGAPLSAVTKLEMLFDPNGAD